MYIKKMNLSKVKKIKPDFQNDGDTPKASDEWVFQLELFPILSDQEDINQYILAQNSLKHWQKLHKIFLGSLHKFEQIVEWTKTYKGEGYSELELKKLQVESIKDMQECESWLKKSIEMKNELAEEINTYSILISEKSFYSIST